MKSARITGSDRLALQHVLGINMFVAGLNERILSGKVPQCMKDDPLLIGQVAHDVIEGGSVYLINCEETQSGVQYIKIGLARNIGKRFSTIESGCPLKLKKAMYFCIGPYGKTYDLEQRLHARFIGYRVRGEWLAFKDKEGRNQGVQEIIAFVEEFLQEDFNSFVFDPEKRNHPDLPILRDFAQTLMALVSDKFGDALVEELLGQFRPQYSRTEMWD